MEEIVKAEIELEAVPESEGRAKTVRVDMTKLANLATASVARVAQFVQLGKDTLGALNPDEVLVVNIPKDIKEGIEKGVAWLNEKKDGSGILPQVMVESESGRKQVKKILTAESKSFVPEDLHRALTQDLNGIYLQQQLPAIAAQLEETLDCVYQIKQGQKDDRVGALLGAINQIHYALDTNDETALKNAIGSLQKESRMLGESLKTLVSTFGEVPESKLQLIVKMVFGMDYSTKRKSELEEIAEYFGLYEKAQEALVVGAYLANGEIGMKSMLAQRRAFLESLDVNNLQTLKNLLPASALEHKWVNEIEEFIAESEREYELLPEGTYNSIEVKVTAGQLLEAIEDDETEE